MRVESTSITISRSARRCSPPRWTATSMPCSTATRARSARSIAGSPPQTSISMHVTGCWASLPIRSMFAPLAAIRPAMAVMAAGASGLPSRVTCSRPPRAAGSPATPEAAEPVVISASRPRSPASALTAAWMPVRSGGERTEQHTEHPQAPDHHLLDVEDSERMPGQDGEQPGGHARPVPAGQGDEQGGPRSIHRARQATRPGLRQHQVDVTELVPQVPGPETATRRSRWPPSTFRT